MLVDYIRKCRHHFEWQEFFQDVWCLIRWISSVFPLDDYWLIAFNPYALELLEDCAKKLGWVIRKLKFHVWILKRRQLDCLGFWSFCQYLTGGDLLAIVFFQNVSAAFLEGEFVCCWEVLLPALSKHGLVFLVELKLFLSQVLY
jgi:hypothetical protein